MYVCICWQSRPDNIVLSRIRPHPFACSPLSDHNVMKSYKCPRAGTNGNGMPSERIFHLEDNPIGNINSLNKLDLDAQNERKIGIALDRHSPPIKKHTTSCHFFHIKTHTSGQYAFYELLLSVSMLPSRSEPLKFI
jgi:hypothetical protein